MPSQLLMAGSGSIAARDGLNQIHEPRYERVGVGNASIVIRRDMTDLGVGQVGGKLMLQVG